MDDVWVHFLAQNPRRKPHIYMYAIIACNNTVRYLVALFFVLIFAHPNHHIALPDIDSAISFNCYHLHISLPELTLRGIFLRRDSKGCHGHCRLQHLLHPVPNLPFHPIRLTNNNDVIINTPNNTRMWLL